MSGWLSRLTGKLDKSESDATPLTNDPRWIRLHDANWTCPICDKIHAGLFDIAYAKPDPYPGAEEYEHNAALPDALSSERDILTEDFCVMGPHRFIRCILPLPIRGSDSQFAFGVWGSLKPEHFEAYVDYFDSPNAGEIGPFFSWLMNKLPEASNQPARCMMHPQNNRQRPVLELEDETHPFTSLQQAGIEFEQLLDLYAQTGHDIRPHLLDA